MYKFVVAKARKKYKPTHPSAEALPELYCAFLNRLSEELGRLDTDTEKLINFMKTVDLKKVVEFKDRGNALLDPDEIVSSDLVEVTNKTLQYLEENEWTSKAVESYLPVLHAISELKGSDKAFEKVLKSHWNFLSKINGIDRAVPASILDEIRNWTGIKGLCALVRGGLPEGRAYMIAGYGNADVSLLGEQFIWSGLVKGEGCIYAVSEEPALKVKYRMLGRRWDVEPYEHSGHMVWVDCFSCTQHDFVPKEAQSVVQAESITFLPYVRMAVNQGVKSCKEPKRVVLNITSTMLKHRSMRFVYPIMQQIVGRLKTRGISALVLINADLHSKMDIASIAHVCDGAIRFERVEEIEDGRLVPRTYLSIYDLKGEIYDSNRFLVEKNGGEIELKI